MGTIFEIFEKNVTFWHQARVSTMFRNKIRNTIDDEHGDKTTGQPAWARSRSWKPRDKSANSVRTVIFIFLLSTWQQVYDPQMSLN